MKLLRKLIQIHLIWCSTLVMSVMAMDAYEFEMTGKCDTCQILTFSDRLD